MKYLIFILLFACQPLKKAVDTSDDHLTPNLTDVKTGYDVSRCNLTKLGLDSNLGSPESINEAIDLVNALPKPVTIDCFIQALNRPLYINTTSSLLSVQPAFGIENPRIFIAINKLIISIVSKGIGTNLMEFSFMYSDTRSLKGEIQFPVYSNLSYEVPFMRVDTNGQSTCSGCHIDEAIDTSVTGTTAYLSKALKPAIDKNVSVTQFSQQNYLCEFNNDETRRCQIIKSLFQNGSVEQFNFPNNTPTYFQSLGF